MSNDWNNMFDFRMMDDEDWEYLSELNKHKKEADERRKSEAAPKRRCLGEHEWVNISLLTIREVCKHCDAERVEEDTKK